MQAHNTPNYSILLTTVTPAQIFSESAAYSQPMGQIYPASV